MTDGGNHSVPLVFTPFSLNTNDHVNIAAARGSSSLTFFRP